MFRRLLARLAAFAASLACCASFAQSTTALNHTALWWNPAESGWGLNVTHQGGIVFATLFTYDASGAPLWLVMSKGDVQSDGITYTGDLLQTTGPAFNANPFTPLGASNFTKVGTMSIQFASQHVAFLTYSVNGVSVSKTVQKLVFGRAPANCVPTTNTNRATLTNYQDLWWSAAESGWGINITHQDDILFATLFTYDTTGKGMWLVMSAGAKQADGSFLGDLYRTTGAPFNANPFTPNTAANLTKVGTMQLRFADGQTGSLNYSVNGVNVTKAITRLAFASPVLVCTTPVMAFTPKLLLPLARTSAVSGFPSMMLLDLSTGQLTQAGISATISLACGAGNLRNDSRVRIVCGIGSSHWDYNTVTNSVTQDMTLPKLPASNFVNVVSGPDGTDYYSVGQYVVPGTGKVLIRRGSTFVGEVPTTSPGSTPTTYVVPRLMLADFSAGKLFTMNDTSQNSLTPVTVDRIDIASLRVDATRSEELNGVAIALYRGELFLAMRRDSAGNDIVKYNTLTFERSGAGRSTGTIGGNGTRYVTAMSVDEAGVHVGIVFGTSGSAAASERGAIQTLSHDLKRVIRTTEFQQGLLQELTSRGDGRLIVLLVPPDSTTTVTNNVVEIDSSTHLILRSWAMPGNPQGPVVIAP